MIAVQEVFLADWMKSMNTVGLPVRIPKLGITGASWVNKAKDLISKMICFDPDTRLKMSDVCSTIQKIQGLYFKLLINTKSFISGLLCENFAANILLMAMILFRYLSNTIPCILYLTQLFYYQLTTVKNTLAGMYRIRK